MTASTDELAVFDTDHRFLFGDAARDFAHHHIMLRPAVFGDNQLSLRSSAHDQSRISVAAPDGPVEVDQRA